jgi:2-keto-3-deoxy-L-rhamnonate aldolase RhmA
MGTWVKLPVPEVMEIIRDAGADFVVIDLEHGLHDARSSALGILAAQSVGLKAYVRVLGHRVSDVQPALDAGADGIFFPHVDSVQLAHDLVALCRFAPAGHRRASPTTRFGRWSSRAPSQLASAGDDLVVVAQVETAAAVESAADIARIQGIDAVFVGTYDLAMSTGLTPGSAELGSWVGRVETAVAGVAALGAPAADATGARALLDRGYGFVLVGSDVTFLSAGAGRAFGVGVRPAPEAGQRDGRMEQDR